jgi:hypothetical protein
VFEKNGQVTKLEGWMDPRSRYPVIDRDRATWLKGEWESTNRIVSTADGTFETVDKITLKWTGDGESASLGSGIKVFYAVQDLGYPFSIPTNFGKRSS